MKHIGLIVLISSLFLNCIFLVERWQRNVVVSVPDGDSIQLADGRRVRLLGIDAPEKGRCMADLARSRLIELSLGRHIRLKEQASDNYGRTLAIVLVNEIVTTNDRLLQRALVSEGLARNRSSSSSRYYQVLKTAQEVARSKKIGIWSEACRSPEPPGGCAIKGNIRAGEKRYYLPDCKQYDQVIIDEAYGDAWFCTEQEAAAAGFTSACGR